MISKYQFMEVNAQNRAVGLRDKIPDIKKTLEMVSFLKRRRDASADPLETSFELNDTLYARAAIHPDQTDEVYLWLGANVMLAYPIAEAETMLREKLAAAELSLAHCEEDLEFLREQITVCPPSSLDAVTVGSFGGCRVACDETNTSRLWKWPPLESITGTSCSGGKKRPKVKATRTRRRQNNLSSFHWLLCMHCLIRF
jgi:prefoldin subunit 5